MTNDKLVDIFTMRIGGSTYEEIAKKYGYTRQYIHEILYNAICEHAKPYKCIYPNLKKWMVENGISPHALYLKMGHKPSSAASVRMSVKLTGEVGFNMSEIISLTALTGMDVKTLFETGAAKNE